MNGILGLEELAKSTSGQVGSITEWVLSLFTVIAFSYIVKLLYVRKSRSIADKNYFSSLFLIFSISIFLIISTIKASLVLSLGMVGALSIVRFRNAIKDTEQVMYLLFLIAFSLALAANQYLIGVISGVVGVLFIYFRNFRQQNTTDSTFLYVTFKSKIGVEEILKQVLVRDNKVVSLDFNTDTYRLVCALNQLSDQEVLTITNWLTQRVIEFRLSTNQIY
jgi:hypothetical protein